MNDSPAYLYEINIRASKRKFYLIFTYNIKLNSYIFRGLTCHNGLDGPGIFSTASIDGYTGTNSK